MSRPEFPRIPDRGWRLPVSTERGMKHPFVPEAESRSAVTADRGIRHPFAPEAGWYRGG